ncbi:MAG: hypothetical protein D3910_28920 [Candidatus Electrothrix sp. ATG2]|nr:hypothetical protein [Candidatus Electrothrix sp. ATG2]
MNIFSTNLSMSNTKLGESWQFSIKEVNGQDITVEVEVDHNQAASYQMAVPTTGGPPVVQKGSVANASFTLELSATDTRYWLIVKDYNFSILNVISFTGGSKLVVATWKK